jgi:hypothetical protein
MRGALFVFIVVFGLSLVACKARTPTYHDNVVPILARHCRECHRPDGIAPTPRFDDYEHARTYAQTLKMSVQTRHMPPFGADNTGLCGTWEDARWLSADEIDTVVRWQEGGAPAGDPRPFPEVSIASPPFRADAAVDIGGVYQPGIGPGGNRCFVADPRLDRDRLLDAIKVVSDDPRGVAQVTLFALDSAAADDAAVALDQAEAGLGYSCFGSARVKDARPVASWTWPRPVLRLPAGNRLHAQRKLVIQIHYDLARATGSFQSATRVNLEFDDHAREAQIVELRAEGPLPPGRTYVSVENRRPVERRMLLVGIAPRMHIRGDALQVAVERGDKSICLGDFDHWHFNDEQLFRLRKGVELQAGDRLRIQCSFRTLGRTQPMQFGDAIDDEECTAWLWVTD